LQRAGRIRYARGHITVLMVRADEAHHRDVNHGLADRLFGGPAVAAPVAPYPEQARADR
jgi:hypothetical protein